jgi:hypothetical protein
VLEAQHSGFVPFVAFPEFDRVYRAPELEAGDLLMPNSRAQPHTSSK